MKFTIEYNANSKGFDLKEDITADIKEDAEALGYLTNVLFETAIVLSKLLESANPKYQQRISTGVQKSMKEKESENNDKYPFTTCIIKDK